MRRMALTPPIARMPRTPAPGRGRGYVLIFIMGVLLVVSVLVLGFATTQRLDTQLAVREKENLQAEFLLRGGLQYLLAQLETARVVDQMGGAVDAKAKEELRLWRLGGGPFTVRLKAGTLRLVLEDAGRLPDANQLTEVEWVRLFRALGVAEALATNWTRRVLDERNAAAARGGQAGFASLDELLAIAELPAEIRFGERRGREARPGLRDLLVVGTQVKLLEVNHSPLLLFRVLLDAKTDDMERLANARRSGKQSVADAARILGQTSALFYIDQSPAWRARIGIAPPPDDKVRLFAAGTGLVAILRQEQNGLRVLDERLVLMTDEPMASAVAGEARTPPGGMPLK